MKKQTLIVVAVLALATLTGCQGQDGGMRVDIVKWDNHGLRIGSVETNGSQVAVGKDANEANARFNTTAMEKNVQNHREEIIDSQSSLTKTLSKQGRTSTEIAEIISGFSK